MKKSKKKKSQQSEEASEMQLNVDEESNSTSLKKKKKSKRDKSVSKEQTAKGEDQNVTSDQLKKHKKHKKMKDVESTDTGDMKNISNESTLNENGVGDKSKKKKKKRKLEETMDGMKTTQKSDKVENIKQHETEPELKHKEKKNKKKKMKVEITEKDSESNTPDAAELATDYLTKWEKDRSNWSFKKVRQVWLLQNMYDVEKLPEEHFPTLLKYLEGLKGMARDKSSQQAEEMIQRHDDDDDSDSDSKKPSREQYDRARQVYQMLA